MDTSDDIDRWFEATTIDPSLVFQLDGEAFSNLDDKALSREFDLNATPIASPKLTPGQLGGPLAEYSLPPVLTDDNYGRLAQFFRDTRDQIDSGSWHPILTPDSSGIVAAEPESAEEPVQSSNEQVSKPENTIADVLQRARPKV